MPQINMPVVGVWMLSGQYRFRPGAFGRSVVLEVEENRRIGMIRDSGNPDWTGVEKRWRKANGRRDLTELWDHSGSGRGGSRFLGYALRNVEAIITPPKPPSSSNQ
jgi:hypothetical protein